MTLLIKDERAMKSIVQAVAGALVFLWLAAVTFPQTVEVSLPSDTTGDPNAAIALPIRVGDLTGKEVISYEGTVTFDQNVLKATGASSTGTLTESFGEPTVNYSVAGEIRIGSFGTTPLAGSGTLVYLQFEVIGEAGAQTDLTFANFMFNSGTPPTVTRNGRLTVAEGTSVAEQGSTPADFRLRQNYPNPFNPETVISFTVPATWTESVTLQIIDIQGRVVRTLIEGTVSPGLNSVVWDGKDAANNPVSSGIYLYRLTSGRFASVRKMVLAR